MACSKKLIPRNKQDAPHDLSVTRRAFIYSLVSDTAGLVQTFSRNTASCSTNSSVGRDWRILSLIHI